MPGLETLTATGVEIKIDGKAYRQQPFDRADWGLIYARIKAERVDPIAVATRLASGATDKVASDLYARAYDDAMKASVVTVRESMTWLATFEGAAFGFWLQLRKEHPELTEDGAAEVLVQYGKEYIDTYINLLAKRFPDASTEELATAGLECEEGMVAAVIVKALGLPEGNSPTPEKPGTPTSPLTGSDGTPS